MFFQAYNVSRGYISETEKMKDRKMENLIYIMAALTIVGFLFTAGAIVDFLFDSLPEMIQARERRVREQRVRELGEDAWEQIRRDSMVSPETETGEMKECSQCGCQCSEFHELGDYDVCGFCFSRLEVLAKKHYKETGENTIFSRAISPEMILLNQLREWERRDSMA